MILHHQRMLAASITAVLLCSTSCSTPESASRTDGDFTSVDDNTGAANAALDPSADQAALQDPDGPQDAERIRQQREELLVEQYLEDAERLRSIGDQASLDAARLDLVKAYQLRPDDPRVTEMLQSVSEALGMPVAQAKDFGSEQARLAEINEQRNRAAVMSLLDSSKQSLREKNYDRAVEDADRALRYIEVNSYVDWGSIENEALEARQTAIDSRDTSERAEAEQLRREVAMERKEVERDATARRKARVDDLMVKAVRAFDRRQFELSSDFSSEALQIDPMNQLARQIYDASIKAGRDKRTDDYFRESQLRMRRMIEEAEDLRVPQTEMLTVDRDVWARASQRQNDASYDLLEDPLNAELRARVASETISGLSFTADDGEFDLVRLRINAITNIPMIITPEAREVIDGEGLTLVMDITAPITVENLLDRMVAQSAELAWTVRSGVVQLATKAQAGGANFLHQKDVRDLVFPRTEFKPPTIKDLPNGEDTGDVPRTGGEGDEPTVFVEMDILVDNIKESTDLEYWESEGGGTIEQTDGYLLIRANQKMHEEVDNVLNDLRRFATTVVTIESKFLDIQQGFLQQIGVDWRGTGGSGNKGTVVQLDDITNGLDDQASRGLDNSGTQDPAGNPFTGFFFNDGADGDYRGRTENGFAQDLARGMTTNGGLTGALTFLGDSQLQMILRAVERRESVQELNSQNVTVLNNQGGYVAIINQTAYVRDFEVEVAQAAFIADPQIDVVQDGVVLNVKPTVSHDRKKITLNMQPTVSELVRPIPTFSTSLAGSTQPVTLQLPQLNVRSFATTVTLPDGASVMLGGLRQVRSIERKAEVPILGRIPLLGFFFKEEGVADESGSLMVLVRATISDVKDLMEKY